jgi:hypothetical protein
VIAHARYTVFQMAEVAVPRDLFRRMLEMIDQLRPRQAARYRTRRLKQPRLIGPHWVVWSEC